MTSLPADPGIGNRLAPVGSKEWAERVRLHSQPIIDQAQSYPEKAQVYVETVTKHRAWTLLNKRDGSIFKSFDEFCEAPKPYGWGIARSKLEALIRIVATEAGENASKAIALATVAEAKEPQPPRHIGPGRGKKTESETVSETVSAPQHSDAVAREAEKLRAINRAPEPARDLFRRDLMSKGTAVALGTTARDTKPEKAAQIAEATAAAVSIVETRKPVSMSEKRTVRREVDAAVREKLGKTAPSAIDRVLGAIEALSREDLLHLRTEIDRLLERK